MRNKKSIPVLRWKRGDVHPKTGLVFWAYDRGREWWKTQEFVNQSRKRFNALQRARRKKDPEKSRAETRKWQNANREKLIKYQREKYATNPEKAKEAARAWRAANKEKARQPVRDWFRKNPNYAKNYVRNRIKKDQNYRITKNLRDRLYAALKGKPRKRGQSGIDAASIINWFDWLKDKGHAPDFRGKGIEIDHTIPISAFSKLETKAASEAANNWRNLFPMTKEKNVEKSAKIDARQIRKVWRLADAYLSEMRNFRAGYSQHDRS